MILRASRLPLSLDPLIREAKRRARQRRLLLAVVAILVAGAAVGASLALRSPEGQGGPSGGSLPASASGSSSSGRVADLQFTYPPRFYARRFENCSVAVTGDPKGGCDRGVVIASYPLQPQPETGGSGAHFPGKGVALELYRPPAGQGHADVKLGDRRLSLWQFNAFGEGLDIPGRKPAAPEEWGAWFSVNGANYWAIAWVGDSAQKSERAALAALIDSVHARGRIPRPAAPKPAPQVTRVACGGTAVRPRVPHDALIGGNGSQLICAQVVGHRCRVWTRSIGAPAADVRERHLQLRKSFCAYTRRFLARDPDGVSVTPARPGLTALLPRPRG
jgi:hypothetical protein